MSIRIRVVDGVMVAVCAARSIPKPDDVYLDDAHHHALANKFASDFASEGRMLPWDDPDAVAREREESNNSNREWWDRTYREADVMPVDFEKVNKRIADVEATVGAIIPAVATAGALIRLVGGLVRGKLTPDQQKTFDAAVADLDAQNATLQTAIDKLREASSGPTGSNV